MRLAYRNWYNFDPNVWRAYVAPSENFGLAGGVQFTVSHFRVSSPQNLYIYIERGEGASGAVSVDVSTFNITGDCAMTAGTNYTAVTNLTLNWGHNEIGIRRVPIYINSAPTVGLHLIGLQLTNASSGLRIKTPVAYIVIDDGEVNPNATVIDEETGSTGDMANIVGSTDEGETYPEPYSNSPPGWTPPGTIVQGDIAGTLASASAGDLIYLRGGRYFDNRRRSGETAGGIDVNTSGTSSAPITIMSYPGETAVIDQEFTLNNDGAGGEAVAGFHIRGTSSYIHFRDLQITRTSGSGIYCDSGGSYTGIVINRCRISHQSASIESVQGRDNVGAIRWDNITDGIISDCHLHNTYAGQLTSNPIDSHPRGMAAGIHGYRPDRCWVHHNTIHHIRSAIQYKQSPDAPLNGYTIHNNLIFEFADYAFELNVQGAGQHMPQQNSFFRNACDSAHSYGCECVSVPVSSPGEQATGLYVYENTVLNCSFLHQSYATIGVYIYSNNVDGTDRVWSIVDPNETANADSEITYNDYDNIYNITQAIGIYFIGRYEPGLIQLDSVTELQTFDQSTHAAIANSPDFANNHTEVAPSYVDVANRDYRTTNMLDTGYGGRPQGIGDAVVGCDIYTAPGDYQYPDWITHINSEMQITMDGFANGPTDFFTNNAYSENGYLSPYYGPSLNGWRFEDWVRRTQRNYVIDQEGLRNALQVHMIRVNDVGLQAWRRDAPLLYYGLNGIDGYGVDRQFPNSQTLGVGTLRSIVNQDFHNCIDDFSYRSLNNFQIGLAAAAYPQGTGTSCRTTGSRRIAYFMQALVMWEREGNSTYLDPIYTTEPMMPWIFNAMVCHIYRWRREWWDANADVGNNNDDSAANFMMAITVKAFMDFYEWSISESPALNVDRFMPNVGASAATDYVLSGECLTTEAIDYELSEVLSPYTSTAISGSAMIDMLCDFVDWQFGAIDMQWTFDTATGAFNQRYDQQHLTEDVIDERSFPQTDTTYLRCHVNHLAKNLPSGAEPLDDQRYVGDPLLFPKYDLSTGVVELLHRTGPTTNSNNRANNERPIQMMCVIECWWLASVLHRLGVDPRRVAKYIRWGDAIFAGAVESGSRFNQKQRNQDAWAVFKALEFRNMVTGRND